MKLSPYKVAVLEKSMIYLQVNSKKNSPPSLSEPYNAAQTMDININAAQKYHFLIKAELGWI